MLLRLLLAAMAGVAVAISNLPSGNRRGASSSATSRNADNWWEANAWSDMGGADYTRREPWAADGSGDDEFNGRGGENRLWESSGDDGHFGSARIDDEDAPIGGDHVEGSGDDSQINWPVVPPIERGKLTPEVTSAPPRSGAAPETHNWWQEHTVTDLPPMVMTTPPTTTTTTTRTTRRPFTTTTRRTTTPFNWNPWTSAPVRTTSTTTQKPWTDYDHDPNMYDTRTREPSTKRRFVEILLQPGILAAVIGGCVVGLLFAIMLVFFVVYRMRKKDEGSYALDEPRGKGAAPPHYAYAYQKAPTKEFYA